MRIILTIAILACSLVNSGYISAQFNTQNIDKIIKKSIKNDSIGLVVLIKAKGKTVYETAYGKANIELSVDMTMDNRVNIASLSKEFTAISILQLMEKKTSIIGR